jgi:hypothetical protein
MFGDMHGALNIDKKLIAQFACILQDKSFKHN